jgi:hypothetical protein
VTGPTYLGGPVLVPAGDGLVAATCTRCPWRGPARTDTDPGRRTARRDHLDHLTTCQEGDTAA